MDIWLLFESNTRVLAAALPPTTISLDNKDIAKESKQNSLTQFTDFWGGEYSPIIGLIETAATLHDQAV